MKEIGGYIELDHHTGTMLYESGIKLNCGRNALAYVIKSKKIEKLLMPKFMCDSCDKVLKENNVSVTYYSIGLDFKPINICLDKEEWIYIVNYYGQLSSGDIMKFGRNIILDNAQSYFSYPIEGVDTIYTCRKFFGVSDGAILYTDVRMKEKLLQDESFDRMHFLLGRFEHSATEFYEEYVANNHFFENQPIKTMSKLTENLLHGLDYRKIKEIRTENFTYLHKKLSGINKLSLTIPEGAFMYPLYIENGEWIRKQLQMKKIFIPTLWPSVFKLCTEMELEYNMAKNILPLPVDQRYSIEDMKYMVEEIIKLIE